MMYFFKALLDAAGIQQQVTRLHPLLLLSLVTSLQTCPLPTASLS